MLCPTCKRILGLNEKQEGSCYACNTVLTFGGTQNSSHATGRTTQSVKTTGVLKTGFVVFLFIIGAMIACNLLLKVAVLLLSDVRQLAPSIRLTALLGIAFDCFTLFLLLAKSRFFPGVLATVMAARLIAGLVAICSLPGRDWITFESWSADGPMKFVSFYVLFWLPACFYLLFSNASKQFFGQKKAVR